MTKESAAPLKHLALPRIGPSFAQRHVHTALDDTLCARRYGLARVAGRKSVADLNK